LLADLPGLNVFTLGYPAGLFASWMSRSVSLYERSKVVLEYLAGRDFGNRDLYLVTHSLGGILAKQILRSGVDSDDAAWKQIAERCRFVAFVATPHSGASLADVLTLIMPRFSSKLVEELRDGNSYLDEINAFYRRHAAAMSIKTLAYYETRPTRGTVVVVPRGSADPGVQAVVPIPVEEDHVSICKPRSRTSPLYVSIRRHLREALSGAAEAASGDGSARALSADQRATGRLLENAKDQWLRDRAAGLAASQPAKAEEARRRLLLGTWQGESHQDFGPTGQPISYGVGCTITGNGKSLEGTFRFLFATDGVVLADEALPMKGHLAFGQFLMLEYSDTVTGKMQFGALLLELSADGTTLSGFDIGIGHVTRKLMTASIELHKVANVVDPR
jgi:hypothetical protein